MLCILCVQTSADFIHIFQDEGSALNIKDIIVKHFWLQPNENDVSLNVICASCWGTLDTFHKFYMQVEDAHVQLQSTSTMDEDDLKLEREIADALRAANAQHFDEILPEPEEMEADVKVEVKEDTDAAVPPNAAEVDIEKHAESQIASTPERRYSTDSENSVEHETPPACSTRSRTSVEKTYAENDSSSDDKIDNDDGTEMQTTSSDWLDLESDIDDDDDDSDYDVSSTTTSKSKSKKQKEPRKTTTKRSCKKNYDPNNEPKKKKRTSEQVTMKMARMKEYDEIIAKSMKLSCDICSEPFASFAIMKRHFRSVHKECGYIACCGKKFRKRGVLVDHICTHNNPDYFKCEKCGRILANRKGLDCHMLTHDTEKQRIYQCDQCPMSFYTKPLLSRHLQTHLSERNIKCPECDKRFSTQDILRTHINNVHNAAYTRICDQCGKSFRRPDAFRRHQLEHDGVTRPLVPCEKCSVKLTSKYGLKRHMQSMHPATDMKHVCDDCGKIAPSAAALQRHISYMHKMERKYKCPMCDKAFKKTGGLKPNADDVNASVICKSCWVMLDIFHSFYLEVEEAHIKLRTTRTINEIGSKLELRIKLEPDVENVLSTDIKVEAEEVPKQLIPTYTKPELQENARLTDVPHGDDGKKGESSFEHVSQLDESTQNVSYPCSDIKLEAEEVLEQSVPTYTLLDLHEDARVTDISSADVRRKASSLEVSTSPEEYFDNDTKRTRIESNREQNYAESIFGNDCGIDDDIQAANTDNHDSDSSSCECNTKCKSKIRSRSKKNQTKKTRWSEEHFSKMDEDDDFIAKNIKLVCDICSEAFAKYAFLIKHYRIVHNKTGYATCCGKKMRARCFLVDHLYTHENPEHFKCENCGKVFGCRKSLDVHMKTHRIKQRPFKCNECPLSFYTAILLRRHSDTHISKNINCTKCDKVFSTDFLVRRHYYNVHNTSNTKSCDKCGMVFRQTSKLQQHLLTHENIFEPLVQCNTCGYKLRQQNLKRHMVIKHSEWKPDIQMNENHPQALVTCKRCNVNLLQENLTKHMEIMHSHTYARNIAPDEEHISVAKV